MNTTKLLLDDAQARLHLAVQRLNSTDALHAAFASWACRGSDAAFSATRHAEEAASKSAGDRTFKDVAVLGYGVNGGEESAEVLAALKSGVEWVTGRASKINDQPAGFCSNGVALLGIALGVKHVNDATLNAQAANWFSSFISEGMRGRAVPEWQQFLFKAAAHVVGIGNSVSLVEDPLTADVRVALRALGTLPETVAATRDFEERDAVMIIRTPIVQDDALRAPLRLTALVSILQQLPTLDLSRPTIGQVIQLLGRVEASLRRWTWEEKARTRGGIPRQWHIDNEYHVQNILWMILSAVFPDLLDEVYTEAFGQLHPRIDLCIPSLKLVIEVKFVRSGARFAKIVEEISSDSGVYLSRPSEYEHLLPFIWDDSARVQEHDYLRIGLKKLPGVVDAVVVSRPSNFSSSNVANSTD